MHKEKIAIFAPFSGDGGVEVMMVRLLKEMVARQLDVDLLLVKGYGPYMAQIPPQVKVIRMSDHTFLSLLPFYRYLRTVRPDVVLVPKHRAGIVALLARRLLSLFSSSEASKPVRIVLSIGTAMSVPLRNALWIKRWWWKKTMQWFYPWAERIIGVSECVADDVRWMSGLDAPRVIAVNNPVVSDDLVIKAQEPVEHPWFVHHDCPVIIGCGRFTLQKDFPNLIRAFARVRQDQHCRLFIMGRGEDMDTCRQLVDELGVSSDVCFAGFIDNPFAYMARADLFVLSSRWEGSPVVLVEALALGIPVVATDCSCGPRETLQKGKIGPLVPVNDAEALARAIQATLASPLASEQLCLAAEPFTVKNSVDQHLKVMGLADE